MATGLMAETGAERPADGQCPCCRGAGQRPSHVPGGTADIETLSHCADRRTTGNGYIVEFSFLHLAFRTAVGLGRLRAGEQNRGGGAAADAGPTGQAPRASPERACGRRVSKPRDRPWGQGHRVRCHLLALGAGGLSASWSWHAPRPSGACLLPRSTRGPQLPTDPPGKHLVKSTVFSPPVGQRPRPRKPPSPRTEPMPGPHAVNRGPTRDRVGCRAWGAGRVGRAEAEPRAALQRPVYPQGCCACPVSLWTVPACG